MKDPFMDELYMFIINLMSCSDKVELHVFGFGCLQEEYEDSQGNVVTKKTYDDLKRQGLL